MVIFPRWLAGTGSGRAVRPDPSQNEAGLAFGLFVVLLIALIFGGGYQIGSWGEGFIQLAGLPLLGFALWRLSTLASTRRVKWALALVGVIAALPLLQLIPLPPSLWTSFSGRQEIAEAYERVGLALPFLPVSLDRGGTTIGFLTLIAPAGIFLATIQVSERAREAITLMLLVFAFFCVVLGLAQVAQGAASPLRPYEISNPGEAVGLFANRNHFAALLYAMIPIAGAWAVWLSGRRELNQIGTVVLILVVFGALMVGVGVTRSRAGVALSIIAVLVTIFALRNPDAAREGGHRVLRTLVAGGIAVAILIALQLTLVRVLGRFEKDVAEDLRWVMAQTTWRAVQSYFPFGSGFGTFPAVYASFEEIPALQREYVNHAHNDFLELMLEGGLPAVLLFVLFLLWFGRRAFGAWNRRDDPSSLLARGATISILLLLAHSIVDYPLRMTALASLFAFFCGLLVTKGDIKISGRGVEPATAAQPSPGVRQ